MATIRHHEMTAADDVRETPLWLFEQLDARFHFDLDAAASPENALCERYFTEGTRFENANWVGKRVFINPPFSQLDTVVRKAWWSDAECVVMICPADRFDRKWWHELVEPYRDGRGKHLSGLKLRTEFVGPGRVQYTVNGGQPILDKKGKKSGCMFATMLLIWTPEV